jgi:hypothetical protein
MERALSGSTVVSPSLALHLVTRAARRNAPLHGLEEKSEETVIVGK